MKILALVLLAILCIQITALAENDTVSVGPYEVNFDIGIPRTSYTITVEDPKTTESLSGDVSTKYVINIKNDTGITRFATITLTQYDEKQTIPSPEDIQLVMKYVMAGDYRMDNIETATRTIDGTQGAVGSCDYTISGITTKTTMGMYYPEIDKGKLSFLLFSAYPWEEGTLQLLKTIHIEKAA